MKSGEERDSDVINIIQASSQNVIRGVENREHNRKKED